MHCNGLLLGSGRTRRSEAGCGRCPSLNATAVVDRVLFVLMSSRGGEPQAQRGLLISNEAWCMKVQHRNGQQDGRTGNR
jgi:hypothetical protein